MVIFNREYLLEILKLKREQVNIFSRAIYFFSKIYHFDYSDRSSSIS